MTISTDPRPSLKERAFEEMNKHADNSMIEGFEYVVLVCFAIFMMFFLKDIGIWFYKKRKKNGNGNGESPGMSLQIMKSYIEDVTALKTEVKNLHKDLEEHKDLFDKLFVKFNSLEKALTQFKMSIIEPITEIKTQLKLRK